MAKIWYHTDRQNNGHTIIWSQATSLTAAGKALARQNEIWPDKSSDGQIITVGKRMRGEPMSSPFHIVPTKTYRLQGSKLVLEGTFVDLLNPFGGLGDE